MQIAIVKMRRFDDAKNQIFSSFEYKYPLKGVGYRSFVSYRTLVFFIWQFIRRQPGSFSLIFLVSFIWAINATVWPYLIQSIIDVLIDFQGDRKLAWVHLQMPCLYAILFWMLVEFGYRAQGFLLAKTMPILEADMRMHLFDHIQNHSIKYFNDNFSGSLANKITDMITQVSQIIQDLLTIFIPSLAGCVLAIIFFSKIGALFTFLLAGWIVIHFAICIFFVKGCDRYENIHGEIRSHLLGQIVDSLKCNFIVNIFFRFNHEKMFIKKFQEREENSNYASKKYVEGMRVILGFLTFLIGGLLINGFTLFFWMRNKVTTGEVVQVLNTAYNISTLVWISGMAMPGLFQAFGLAKQALSVLKDLSDNLDIPESKPLKVAQGDILFEKVTFDYGEKKLFNNMNVHIRGGEWIGIVGYSGAGKSTFLNLLLRLMHPQEGKIYIDGQDINHVTLESLRSQVSLIPQDPLLFHRSIIENIRYGKLDATYEEVVRAAKIAHADEFIHKFLEKYHTMVGEGGTKMSGGERQRIAIARSLLLGAPILMFDEATSGLDFVTEMRLLKSLKNHIEGKTVLVAAHRLSTLQDMDRILVFHNGAIIEQGTHEELLNSGFHYAYMWRMQMGDFREALQGKELELELEVR